MSKSKIDTRQKILDKALEMFNERGIEYVGLRELASVLGIRVSNITYYFSTKDDLVYQLSRELSQMNSKVIVARESLTIITFLQMLYQVFQNQVKFRCLLLSIVHLMKQNKHLAATYEKTQTIRKTTIKVNLQVLANGGYLKINDEAEVEFLVSSLSLINRFWISEAAISVPQVSIKEHISHHLTFITKLLFPYTTAKAKKDIKNFLENF